MNYVVVSFHYDMNLVMFVMSIICKDAKNYPKSLTFAQILCHCNMKRAHVCIITAILCLVSCRNDQQYIAMTGFAQGGTWTVKCKVPQHVSSSYSRSWGEDTRRGIDSILVCIDNAVSGYNKASLLSRQNAGEEILPDGSPEYGILDALTRYCDSLYIATGGVVDTRAATLYDVWGFGFKSGEMPTEAQVAEAAADRSRMNFNAVAQGYSADLVGSYLKGLGVTDMLVDVGGEIYCCGLNPAGKGWSIGIDAPVDGNMNPGEKLQGIFSIEPGRSCGVVTSGNYRKFYIRDGVKYSHTVDPRKAAPVKHNLLSATILAPTSALADALATYCMVVGLEEASEFICSRSDLEGCLISADSLWTSPGFVLAPAK